MEHRNRTILVVLTAVVIVAAIFSSFGLNLFGTTVSVHFPENTPTGGQTGPDQPGQTAGGDQLQRVEITPETVQTVIAQTLKRPETYSRTVTVTTYRGDGTADAQTSRVYVSGGWSRTETDLSGGGIRYTIVGEGMVYRWYDGDRKAVSWPAEEDSADVEGQRIPTYEDVLALETSAIVAAGYETRGGVSCILVETGEGTLGYRQRYWISVSSGLLQAAEILEGDRLIYQMTAGEADLSGENARRFALPDGTLLYQAATPAPVQAADPA